MPPLLLRVSGLTTRILTPTGPRTVVDDLTFDVRAKETLGVIGESGSGKSMATLSIMGLLPSPPARVVAGTAFFEGRDLLALSDRERRAIRGDRIGMIFQEPQAALNPMMSVGDQIAETLVTHRGATWKEARAETLRLLDRVRIADPQARARLFPSSLSGGMCQRVVIAAALACKPSLVIADEPTTALDATVQAEILALLKDLQAEVGCGILFITHDMGVVRQMADRILVLKNGRVLETGSRDELLSNPRIPYTRALIKASEVAHTKGALSLPPATLASEAVDPLVVDNISVSFARSQSLATLSRQQRVFALDRVSLRIGQGETLALVGESGSGKTTLARAMLGLTPLDTGRILIGGHDVVAERRALRGRVQYVFQDPQSSLDPRWPAWRSVTEPLWLSGERDTGVLRKRAAESMGRVGLGAMMDRFAHELSGGQRQRLGIARALSATPELVIADEAVSALDPTTRLQVLEVFEQVQRETQVPLLFITHDLSVVARIAHRVAVLRFGHLVEVGPTRSVLENPQHPYTKALVAAATTGIVSGQPRTLGHRIGLHKATIDRPPMQWVCPGHFVALETDTQT